VAAPLELVEKAAPHVARRAGQQDSHEVGA
jgi:hypothetical protein